MLHSFNFTTKFIAACAVFMCSTAVFSHVTLEKPAVDAASYTKAVHQKRLAHCGLRPCKAAKTA